MGRRRRTRRRNEKRKKKGKVFIFFFSTWFAHVYPRAWTGVATTVWSNRQYDLFCFFKIIKSSRIKKKKTKKKKKIIKFENNLLFFFSFITVYVLRPQLQIHPQSATGTWWSYQTGSDWSRWNIQIRQRANRESPCTNPRILFFFLMGQRGWQTGESSIYGGG